MLTASRNHTLTALSVSDKRLDKRTTRPHSRPLMVDLNPSDIQKLMVHHPFITDLTTSCAARGFLINKFTFPGQNVNRTLSSYYLGPTLTGGTILLTHSPTPPISILPITDTPSWSASIPSMSVPPRSRASSISASSPSNTVVHSSGAMAWKFKFEWGISHWFIIITLLMKGLIDQLSLVLTISHVRFQHCPLQQYR